MKNIDRDSMYVGQEVIYYYPTLRHYFYTKIVSIRTMGYWEDIFIELGATTGAMAVSIHQLYYSNPENKTEALLAGINIRPKTEL